MKNVKKIKILVVEPNKKPYVSEIDNDLQSLQKQVDGYIEIVKVEPKSVIVMNEEGKIKGYEMNRRLPNDIICGTFFVCGESRNKFSSISDKALEIYTDMFEPIPEFSEYEKYIEPQFEVYDFDIKL